MSSPRVAGEGPNITAAARRDGQPSQESPALRTPPWACQGPSWACGPWCPVAVDTGRTRRVQDTVTGVGPDPESGVESWLRQRPTTAAADIVSRATPGLARGVKDPKSAFESALSQQPALGLPPGSLSGSEFAKNEVECPAAAHVRPRPAQVPEDLAIRVARLLQGVGEYGEPDRVQGAFGKDALLVGGPGQLPDRATVQPEQVRVKQWRRVERVPDEVTKEVRAGTFNLAGRASPSHDDQGDAPRVAIRHPAGCFGRLQ